jgi:lysyl oxidase-like protein 2/3/4
MGLIATRNLSQHPNIQVLLIEVRNRNGGRTWTAKTFGEKLEMGRTWLRWNQPHLDHEIHRYGLHKHLKTSAGAFAPETQYFSQGDAPIRAFSLNESAGALERVAEKSVIYGLDTRTLMPFPHDPFREPASWR